MDNLEHGWLLGGNYGTNRFVGYCNMCEEPLYESDEYEIICFSVFCPHCAKIEMEYEVVEDE